jgi:spore coat protein U-like protein
MRQIRRCGIFLCWVLLATTSVWAQECQVIVNPIRFEVYDVNSASPLNATGSLQVACAPQTAFTVTLDAGLHSGGNFLQRNMASGADKLMYNLFLDAAGTQLWGDGTQGTQVYAGITNALITVYAKIPARQNVTPGEYRDSIVFTITW